MLYRVRIKSYRQVFSSSSQEAVLAVLKDLEIDIRKGNCPDIEVATEDEAKRTWGYSCPKTGSYFLNRVYHDENCIACKPWECIACHKLVDKKLIWQGKCDDCQTLERYERDNEIAKFLAQ